MVTLLPWILLGYLAAAAWFCLIFAMELAWPREEPGVRWRALLFTAVFIPATMLIGHFLSGAGVAPFDAAPGGTLGLVILGLLLGDFLYYWFHRLQHGVPLLWRFHSVHHSVEKMGALAGYHHITENALQTVFVVIPMSLIVADPKVGLTGFAAALFGNYLHSTTRLHLGPLAKLFPDNRSHRTHHSTDPRHFNRNFGTLTMIWDQLFGTAYFPASDEWPQVGLPDMREPRTIGDYLLARVNPDRPSVDVAAVTIGNTDGVDVGGAGIEHTISLGGVAAAPLGGALHVEDMNHQRPGGG